MEKAQPQRQLEALLVEPTETLDVEFKSWLNLATDNEHKAVLAKAVIALANHGGGVIVIGFRQNADRKLVPDKDNRPQNLSEYNTDSVNSAANSYIEPPLHCEIYHVKGSENELYPVIIVPPGKMPTRSKRSGPNGRVMDQNQYFIRRPGPKSEVPQSSQEWDALISRCVIAQRDKLVDQVRALLAGANSPTTGEKTAWAELDEWNSKGIGRWQSLLTAGVSEVARLRHGFVTISYFIKGAFDRPDLDMLREMIANAAVRHSGWPLFVSLSRESVAPYPYEGFVEAWIGRDSKLNRPSNSDYWRASPDGRFFSIRGLIEDGAEGVKPGEVFDVTYPVWLVAEALLHGAAMAELLGDAGAKVELRVEWNGLEGRRLTHLLGTRHISDGRVCRQRSYVGCIETQADLVSEALPELVNAVVGPLFQCFGFFRVPERLAFEEIQRMRGIVVY